MSKKLSDTTKNEAGFTIVELMIATVVFSMILVIITVGVIAFSNQYYKSVNATATQNTTRNAIDMISQSIQFSGASITETKPANSFFCAGGYVFSYGKAILYNGGDTTNANLGLYMQPINGSCKMPSQPFTNGKQLLSKNQRVTNLSVTSAGNNLYAIDIAIAFGEKDVLCSTDGGVASGNCSGSGNLSEGPSGNMWGSKADSLSCRSGPGAPYCANSILKTVVEKRLGT